MRTWRDQQSNDRQHLEPPCPALLYFKEKPVSRLTYRVDLSYCQNIVASTKDSYARCLGLLANKQLYIL